MSIVEDYDNLSRLEHATLYSRSITSGYALLRNGEFTPTQSYNEFVESGLLSRHERSVSDFTEAYKYRYELTEDARVFLAYCDAEAAHQYEELCAAVLPIEY
jgi:hypothetical protein